MGKSKEVWVRVVWVQGSDSVRDEGHAICEAGVFSFSFLFLKSFNHKLLAMFWILIQLDKDKLKDWK